MKGNSTRRWAAVLIGAVGAVHLLLVPEYLGEQPYLGMLFALGTAGCALVSTRLWQSEDTASWVFGSFVAAGMAIGFVLSRTVGLPGFHESDWELSGVVSLLLELLFMAVAVVGLRSRKHASLKTSQA